MIIHAFSQAKIFAENPNSYYPTYFIHKPHRLYICLILSKLKGKEVIKHQIKLEEQTAESNDDQIEKRNRRST